MTEQYTNTNNHINFITLVFNINHLPEDKEAKITNKVDKLYKDELDLNSFLNFLFICIKYCCG